MGMTPCRGNTAVAGEGGLLGECPGVGERGWAPVPKWRGWTPVESEGRVYNEEENVK